MRKIVAVIFAIVSAASALGQDGSSGVHVSTLGYGGHGQYVLGEQFAVRGFINGYNRLEIMDFRGNKYDSRLTLRSAGVVFDWRLGAGFRLSLGGFYNGNRIDATVVGTVNPFVTGDVNKTLYEVVELNSKEYRDLNLRAELDYTSFAPYLGFGWTTLNDQAPLVFFVDIGAIFQEKGRLRMFGEYGSCRFNISLGRDPKCEDAEFESDLHIEYREALNDLDIKYLPVLTIGFSFAL